MTVTVTPGLRPLNQLAPGEEARVARLDGPLARVRRMMALGLNPGVEVRLIRRAPLGDPLELAVAGCLLAIRAEEAGSILVGA